MARTVKQTNPVSNKQINKAQRPSKSRMQSLETSGVKVDEKLPQGDALSESSQENKGLPLFQRQEDLDNIRNHRERDSLLGEIYSATKSEILTSAKRG